MLSRRSRRAAALGALLALTMLTPTALLAQRYVPTKDPGHPKVKYGDSLVSLNDGCVVTGNKLNLVVRPVYVNGQPIGFC